MAELNHLANALPALPVAVPLLSAAFVAGLRKHISRAVADSVALAASATCLLVCLALLAAARNRLIVYWFGNWYPRGSMVLGITFVIDPVAAGMALLCAVLTFLALLFSWRFIDAGANHYQPLMLIFLAGMTGFCLTGDLFNLFVFFELMSTAAFALTGLKTNEPSPLQGAFNFAVTNTIAAFMILTGIAFLYAVTGALNMAQIGLALVHRHDPLVLFACALITCGFFTKAAIVPFHFWLADAHAVSPTPVCVLFSGVMVELGLYAVLRLYTVIFIPAFDQKAVELRAIMLCFGVATAVYGGLMCYAQHHIKRMLAFSTISHSGLMLTAVAVQGPVATAGFLSYLVAHALIKSSLFFVAGILLHRFRTASEPALFGRAMGHYTPMALWFLGGLGLAGAPGFFTVVGDAFTTNAAESIDIYWLSSVFVIAAGLTTAAVFRVGFHTFLGWGKPPISDRAAQVDELPETPDGQDSTPWYVVAPPALCVAAAVGLSFSARISGDILSAANRFSNQPAYLHAVYFGSVTSTQHLVGANLPTHAAIVHGIVACALALALALTSVFRGRMSRAFRIGGYLEGGIRPLRMMQSGHIGDYVLWMIVGAVTLSMAYEIFLR